MSARAGAGMVTGAAAVLAVSLAVFRACHDEKPSLPAGLPPEIRPIEIVVATERVRARSASQAADKRRSPVATCQTRAAMHMGLLPADVGRVKPIGLLDLAIEAAYPAFYASGSDTVYTSALSSSSTAHEYVHALHDQYRRKIGLRDDSTTDGMIALRAVFEGTAAVLTANPAAPVELGGDLDSNALVIAYREGPRYVLNRAGRDAMSIFGLNPRSTAEVTLGYPVAFDTLEAAKLDAGERILCSDRLGAAGLITIVGQVGMTRSEAVLLVQSWKGDRLDLIAGPHGTRAVWAVSLASPAAERLWKEGPAVLIPLTRPATRLPVYSTRRTTP